jgi:hypothetical protein
MHVQRLEPHALTSNAALAAYILLHMRCSTEKFIFRYNSFFLNPLKISKILFFTQFDSFLASAKAVGVELEVEDSKKLADALDRAENPDDPYFNKVNFIQLKKNMYSI